MKRYLTTFGVAILASLALAQFNMQLESNWDNPSLPSRFGVVYNDIWGYAGNGTEIAIVGTTRGVYFIDVTLPTSPQVINYHLVINLTDSLVNKSAWRDFKTYSHYAYACSDEGASGLVIYDLQYLPDSVVKVNQTTEFFVRSHNIYVDTEHARLYATGANTSGQDVIILDLTDPDDPVEIGSPTLACGYVHDIHVVDHVGFCSSGFTELYVYDFTNPAAPVLLGSLDSYSQSGYNHSSWLDETGTKLVFCEETHGTPVKLLDVSDYELNASDVTNFGGHLLPTDSNNIAHNPFILGDLVFISYYHDGVQVFDISDPTNITNVAWYDTEPLNTNYNGFDGSWGVYPFLPSGMVIATDVKNGLFVLNLTGGLLPVEFIDFKAKGFDRAVELNWITNFPDQGSYFDVEHSTDQLNFQKIGSVEANADQRSYSFTHDAPSSRLNSYRIIAIDPDGDEANSGVQHVNMMLPIEVKLYPSVAQDFIVLELPDGLLGQAVEVIDVQGRKLLKGIIDDSYPMRLEVSSLLPGQYFIRIDGTQILQKFQKL